MAAEHHGMDPEHASLLETANTLMTLAFALEMVLKLIGLEHRWSSLGSVQPHWQGRASSSWVAERGARGRGRGASPALRARVFLRAS